MPQETKACVPQLLSPVPRIPEAHAPGAYVLPREKTAMRSPFTAATEQPQLTTTRKALAQHEDSVQPKTSF